MIWNLVENAVNYSPDGLPVDLTVAARDGHVEIAVRDQGPGVPKREQRRIFERFVRGSASREQNVTGTGIGLATALEIVRAHRGDILLDSDGRSGSTFTVRLPAAAAPES